MLSPDSRQSLAMCCGIAHLLLSSIRWHESARTPLPAAPRPSSPPGPLVAQTLAIIPNHTGRLFFPGTTRNNTATSSTYTLHYLMPSGLSRDGRTVAEQKLDNDAAEPPSTWSIEPSPRPRITYKTPP